MPDRHIFEAILVKDVQRGALNPAPLELAQISAPIFIVDADHPISKPRMIQDPRLSNLDT